ncbi:GDP-mannose-dependent alpha-mannosyltransferase [Alteripontixanthobacter maritimus]|uniref:GDP-mannose-dependent alpha-mannosyltransferase n=1 Tax=Alteripontixanthobacter maritimus TaxID=2161824 RepID=A0A369QAN6_9SPHN|nr:glycosyltransferase family 1 protein [Alteripontixanthobacter maritimus]RDC60595.1 GDP-mannose-dependent alpha-mannosyltransferase [Alteripontixanthobacter maritimus]
MDITDLRIALFSGNYNYTRDGANQALNRLVGYLLRSGAQVRVYAPTVAEPDFEPTGDLVSVPSVRFPMKGRGEYRFPLPLSAENKTDIDIFAPNVVHIASPDMSGHAALRYAQARNIPVLASVHTRFETYPRYYRLGFIEPAIVAMLRRFYSRCDALVAPSPSMIDTLRQQGMNDDISLWTRGVDRAVFHPDKRDMTWRRELGLSDEDVAIVFLGRLVAEKALDVFAGSIDRLRSAGVPHKVLVIGDGPERASFAKALPGAVFAGFQTGGYLGRALASGDVFFNPSITETFGNVTLEAMACELPCVAAAATGSASLVDDGVSGRLVQPGDTAAFADALAPYCTDPQLRRSHGRAGEKRAQDYDWDAINQTVADSYLRLAANA